MTYPCPCCPECGHPLQHREINLGKCTNCQESWDPEDHPELKEQEDDDIDIDDLELDDDDDF